jgi:hypothetical protein
MPLLAVQVPCTAGIHEKMAPAPASFGLPTIKTIATGHPAKISKGALVDKRQFLAATAVGAVALPAQVLAQQTPKAARSPVLLTVTGAVGKGNRGAFDPVLDQMMGKQKIKFDKAHAFDFAALAALPAVSIRPTLEYDSKPHALKGPLLTDVARAAGAPMEGLRFLLRAVDGYNVILSLADARKYRFIVVEVQPDRSRQELLQLRRLRLAETFLWRSHLVHAALVHEDHAVADLAREVHLVRDHQQRHAFLGQGFHHAQHLAHQLRVQRAGDLVAQQHGRLHGQRAGDGHALLLPA